MSFTILILESGQPKFKAVKRLVQIMHWQTCPRTLSSADTRSCLLCHVSSLFTFLPLQPLRVNSQPGPQKRCLFVCRHGERMDVVFGKYWLSQCFDAKGEYSNPSPFFSTVLLSLVSADHSQPWSEKIKWKITEINKS